MGCDIHMHIEHRDTGDSPWRAIGKWRPLGEKQSSEYLEYFDLARYEEWHRQGRCPHPDVVLAAKSPEAPWLVESPIKYTGCSPTLFAALAGVRNNQGVLPIAEPRGMPDDATAEVASEWARWGPDAHSASHFTLTELTLWEGWQQSFETEVWVAEGSRSERRRLSDDQMSLLSQVANWLGELPPLNPDAWNLSTCVWSSDPEPWRVLRFTARLDLAVGAEWWRFMAEVHRIGVLHGPGNVRAVFWFDN